MSFLEPTARLRVAEDLQNLDSSSRGLLTEIRQFHQLRISLLLSLRRFDELYKHLSAQINACLSGEITTASPLQVCTAKLQYIFDVCISYGTLIVGDAEPEK